MAHNGGARIRSVSGRNNHKPSGKDRDRWRQHKVVRMARIARRLAKRRFKKTCTNS